MGVVGRNQWRVIAGAMVILLSACSAASCPSGSMESGGRCVDVGGSSSVPGDKDGSVEGKPDGSVPAATEDGSTPDGQAAVPVPDSGAAAVCQSNVDCPQAAQSRCGAGGAACEPCVTSADCSHIPGKNVCDAGLCVVCKNGEEAACGDFACDAATDKCSTSHKKGAVDLCNTCISNGNCRANMVCGQQVGDKAQFTCMPAPTCVQPFVSTAVTDPAGDTVTGCSLQSASCVAYLGWNDSCRFDVDCEAGSTCSKPPGSLTGSCTLPCATNADCLAGHTCKSPGVIITGGTTGKVCF